jgi:hypothetical protein
MPIPKPRDFYGLKYLVLYDLLTRAPHVLLRVVSEMAYESTQDRVPLQGGDSEAPWDVEYSQPDPTMTCTVREYPIELYQVVETTTISTNAAESNGSASGLANVQGTSVFDGSNGVSAVAVKTAEKANLKFGKYVFKATAAQTLEVYVLGVASGFDNIKALFVTSVDCSSSGTVDIDSLGITLTVTGTAAFTTGDTAVVDIRPENLGSESVIVGKGTVPSEFGLMCIFPKKTDGVLHYIDVFRCSARGMPWRATSREWSEFELNITPLVNTDNSIYEMVRCIGV